MNIDEQISKWEEKHFVLLSEYSKGNINNQVMQMYRSQMADILTFVNELQQIKSNVALAGTQQKSQLISFCDWYKKTRFNCEGHSSNDCVDAFIEGNGA
jgi:hypothetical protein